MNVKKYIRRNKILLFSTLIEQRASSNANVCKKIRFQKSNVVVSDINVYKTASSNANANVTTFYFGECIFLHTLSLEDAFSPTLVSETTTF